MGDKADNDNDGAGAGAEGTSELREALGGGVGDPSGASARSSDARRGDPPAVKSAARALDDPADIGTARYRNSTTRLSFSSPVVSASWSSVRITVSTSQSFA